MHCRIAARRLPDRRQLGDDCGTDALTVNVTRQQL